MEENRSMYQLTDFKEVTSVYIMLGSACNMHCKHCSQTLEKQTVSISNKISAKTLKFLVNYVKFCMIRNRKCFLYFWGGEPLLYWNKIKEITEYLSSYVTDYTYFHFSITTNGLLMDDDKVQFLNQYNFYVNVSYDAPHPFVLRDYVPDSCISFIKKLKYYFVGSIGSPKNCDFLTALSYLRKKFPNAKEHTVYARWVSPYFNMPKEICDYDWDIVRQNLKKVRIGAQLGNVDCIEFWCSWFNTIQQNIKKKGASSFEDLLLYCVPCKFVINVDLAGNLFLCHNSDVLIGNLDDEFDIIYNKGMKKFSNTMNKECASCRHSDICTIGACVLEYRKNNKMVACDVFRKPYYDILKEEMHKLNNTVLEEEKEWYYQQLKN